MTANGIHSINRLPRLFFKLVTWGFVCAQTAFAVPVDTKSYDPASGVVVRVVGRSTRHGVGHAGGFNGVDAQHFRARSFGAIDCSGTGQGKAHR